jgi:hypothetical protein
MRRWKAARLPDSKPDAAPAQASENKPLVEGEDFYREGPYVVFTETYHLRRGYCCGSGCRHCPWTDKGQLRAINEQEAS